MALRAGISVRTGENLKDLFVNPLTSQESQTEGPADVADSRTEMFQCVDLGCHSDTAPVVREPKCEQLRLELFRQLLEFGTAQEPL